MLSVFNVTWEMSLTIKFNISHAKFEEVQEIVTLKFAAI